MPPKPRRTTSRSKRDLRKALVEQTGDESLLFADGFDAAIIGSAVVNGTLCVVYDKERMIKQLMKTMSFEEAHEYFDFNIQGANVGDNTPIYFQPLIITLDDH
jgi:hypothetical protein